MKNLVATLLISSISIIAFGQDLTQNIKGTIIDHDSKIPIPGATIIIEGSNPIIGTTSDLEGFFRLEDVPAGRVNLKISFIGYEDKTIPNIVVDTGKEVVLNIEITESFVVLDEIEITSNERKKNEALNEMSVVSARTISVEETKRYAGTLNDPARMVGNYAGAHSIPSGNNDIIVRGNSSQGILWRLEGIEIPNPNHFAGEGATGGPINALNSSMLANSDFYTGAFSPEYGNVLSGAFDMKLRQGNNEKMENDISVGVIGIDITTEGPLPFGNHASYLVNARYSSLELLNNLGLVDFGGVPKYKDISFKFHMPTKKAGAFSLFGLGGKSDISLDSTYLREYDMTNIDYQSVFSGFLGVVGLNHIFFTNEQTYLNSFVSLSTNGVESSFLNTNNTLVEFGQYDIQSKNAFRTGTTYNKKINSQNKVELGLIYTRFGYSFDQDYITNDVRTQAVFEKGNSALLQGFVGWKHRTSETGTIISGIHNTLFLLNNTFSIEPRLAYQKNLANNQSLTIGAGLYSKNQSLPNYFVKIDDGNGNIISPNEDLGLTKALHLVSGYSKMFSPILHMKIEAYYQHLFGIPVENDINSTNSIINSLELYEQIDLVNEGKGRNYGLELTLERYLTNNFYILYTGSLYESRYAALDGVWRNTRWNANYATNFLIGKEFFFKPKNNKQRSLSLNSRASLIGGYRYNPINLTESRLQTAMIRYENPPFESRGDDIFMLNIGVAYKVNRKKSTQEIKIEVLNATNHGAKVEEYYAPWIKDVIEIKQWGMLPNIIYRIQF